jgi:hypothetical protein
MEVSALAGNGGRRMTERDLGRWIARAIVAAGVVFVAVRSTHVFGSPPGPDDSVWDQIFAATEVVAAARLAVILGCVYLAGTFVALSVEGRWLVRAGPAGAEVEGLGEMFDEEAKGYIEELEGELAKLRADIAASRKAIAGSSDRILELEDSVDGLFEIVSGIRDHQHQ